MQGRKGRKEGLEKLSPCQWRAFRCWFCIDAHAGDDLQQRLGQDSRHGGREYISSRPSLQFQVSAAVFGVCQSFSSCILQVLGDLIWPCARVINRLLNKIAQACKVRSKHWIQHKQHSLILNWRRQNLLQSQVKGDIKKRTWVIVRRGPYSCETLNMLPPVTLQCRSRFWVILVRQIQLYNCQSICRNWDFSKQEWTPQQWQQPKWNRPSLIVASTD